jgi:hypothetical protein
MVQVSHASLIGNLPMELWTIKRISQGRGVTSQLSGVTSQLNGVSLLDGAMGALRAHEPSLSVQADRP